MPVIACPAYPLKLKPLKSTAFLAGAVVFLLAAATPAAAIPSPELVVGSFTFPSPGGSAAPMSSAASIERQFAARPFDRRATPGIPC